jgi:hypothetical protein
MIHDAFVIHGLFPRYTPTTMASSLIGFPQHDEATYFPLEMLYGSDYQRCGWDIFTSADTIG